MSLPIYWDADYDRPTMDDTGAMLPAGYKVTALVWSTDAELQAAIEVVGELQPDNVSAAWSHGPYGYSLLLWDEEEPGTACVIDKRS